MQLVYLLTKNKMIFPNQKNSVNPQVIATKF